MCKSGRGQTGEAAESAKSNKDFLSSILQASASLYLLFLLSIPITAFCHPSHLAHGASAGHFALLRSPCVLIAARALASATTLVHVSSSQTSSRWKEKCCVVTYETSTAEQTYPSALIHWPVMTCLSASLSFTEINPIYSPGPVTTNIELRTR